MFSPVRFAFAVALAAVASLANAEDRTWVTQDPGRTARVNAAKVDLRQLQTLRVATAAPKAGTEIAVSVPPLPSINPLRAYPPSCLADPLPDQTSGPTYSTTANLAAFDSNSGNTILEGVNIVVWRVVCSSSEFFTSATLMRIQRQAQYEGDNVIYPLFPSIEVDQGSINFGETPESYVRSTSTPNTVTADTLPDTPIVFSTTYVLENYVGAGAGFFDFNLDFGLRFNNLFPTNNFFFINVPDYNPTVGTYPAAFQNLPISGYLSTNWYDPDASGEGVVLQIYERVNQPNVLVVSFSWSAFDDNGFPFWLFGQADITRGAKSVTTPMAYRTGGGLGGNAGTAGPPQIWGSATVSFPDCNSMTFTYGSNPGLPAFVPQGSGTRNWIRVAGLNGLPCE